jgi:chemotaxis signal transduction protein
VVNTEAARGHVTSGLVVDAVCDVCEIAAASIQAAPDIGPGLDREVMRGLCTLQGRLVILLEPERLLRHITAGSEAAQLAADSTVRAASANS